MPHFDECCYIMGKKQVPGDSKGPFYPLVEGHLAFERVT